MLKMPSARAIVLTLNGGGVPCSSAANLCVPLGGGPRAGTMQGTHTVSAGMDASEENGGGIPTAPNGHGLRDTVLMALLLVVALGVVFPGTFLRGEVIGPADVLYDVPPWDRNPPPGHKRAEFRLQADVVTFFTPLYSSIQRSLKEGSLPTCNPYQFAGLPMMANYQSSVFYPLRLLLLVLDLPWAMTAFVLIKLWLCGMTAWACGRGMGFRSPVACFFSLAWMLSGYCLLWANWPLTDVACWMPVLFLGVDLILRGRETAGLAVATPGATLLLLAGHPETAFAFALGLGMYFLFRILWALRFREPVVRPVALCCIVWVLALLACAVQIAPFIEYLVNSATFGGRANAAYFYPITAAAALWAPRFFGTWTEWNFWGDLNSHLYSMLYVGAALWIAVMLLPAVLKAGRNGENPDLSLNRRRVVCLVGALCVCLLLAFNAPTIGAINNLPVLSSMILCYHAAFAVFALNVLAAIGLNGWIAARRRLRDFAWIVPPVLVVAAVLVGLYQFNYPLLRAQHQDAYVLRQVLRAALFAALSIAVLGIQALRPAPRLVPLLLAAVAAADLINAQYGLNPTLPREQFFPKTALIQELQKLGHPCRIGVSEGGIIAGPMAVFGIEDWVAYDGLYPARMWNFQRGLGADFWVNMEPAAAIAYYLNDPKFPPIMPKDKLAGMEYVSTQDGIDIYRNPASLPRARFVANVEVIPDFDTMLARMKTPGFSPAKTALLEKAPAAPLPPAADAPPGEAQVTHFGSSRVTVEYDSRAPGLLVLADAWDAGWKCRVNGVSAKVFPVYHVFRGVIVPAGKGTVEFVYDPLSLRLGMTISAATLLVWGLWGAWRLRILLRAPTP